LKPWLKSTGAKSVEGKARSSQNALKHGLYADPMLTLENLLRQLKCDRRGIAEQISRLSKKEETN
jgi:hypothetical protein